MIKLKQNTILKNKYITLQHEPFIKRTMDVKAVIKEKGWTQERVAEKMGISRITLNQNLARNPTINTLQRIANVIGCNVGEFFLDELSATNTIICPHCGKKIVFSKQEEE